MNAPFDVLWLKDLSNELQDEYFKVRQRCYLERWASRIELEDGFGYRDEYDDDHVVVALGSNGSVLGGVRVNVARRAQERRRLLPLEKSWKVRLAEIFPEHGLDAVDYAEASKLFLSRETTWLQGPAITLRMLNFLLDNVGGVAFTYLGLPYSLLRMYKMLAKVRGIEYVFRELEGIKPHSTIGENASLRWGVFACVLKVPAIL